jgi:isoleucyl-tRNA synthetase
MTYAILRALDDDEGILIVARERVHALSEVIGHFEDLGNIQGIVSPSWPSYLLIVGVGSDLVDAPYLSLFPNLANPTKLKIIPSTHVTPTSGTGLVHCAPAHGAEDYLAFRSLSSTSSLVCHVDLEGRFTEQITGVLGDKRGMRLVGLEVLYKGGKEMVELLRELRGQEGGGRLVREEKVKHRYPYDWKTGKPVIVLCVHLLFANCGLYPAHAITGRPSSGLRIWSGSRMTR